MKEEQASGWTPWELPPRLLACCDCGLVHRVEMRLNDKTGIIEWRLQRAEGHTRKMRKAMRK